MPELPEVEITKRKLEPPLKGKRILNFWTDWPRGLRISSRRDVSKDIRGRRILKLERRGKAILLHLAGGRILGFHQRMSGKILVVPRYARDTSADKADVHIHYRFDISNQLSLVLHDTRKFGVVWYGSAEKVLKDKYLSKLGQDPLKINFKKFRELLRACRAMIKPLLLRQDVFAGIGNIVADEVLWKAKVHPRKRAEDFNGSEVKRLYQAIRYIVSKSIRLGGTTMRDWLHPDRTKGGYFPKRLVYQRKGEKCQRCGTIIIRMVVGSRSTFICKKCQKLK